MNTMGILKPSGCDLSADSPSFQEIIAVLAETGQEESATGCNRAVRVAALAAITASCWALIFAFVRLLR